MISDDTMKEELAGTTAVIVLMKDQTIYCVSSRNIGVPLIRSLPAVFGRHW